MTQSEWVPKAENTELVTRVKQACGTSITDAYGIADKQQRQDRLSDIRKELVEQLTTEDTADEELVEIKSAIKDIEKSTVRGRILSGQPRIAGPSTTKSTIASLPDSSTCRFLDF